MARHRDPRFIISGSDVWIVLQLDEHWDSYVRFVAEEGRPVVAELRVLPTLVDEPDDAWIDPTLEHREWLRPPLGGLTSRALRHIHLGKALDLAYQQIDQILDREEQLNRPMPTTFSRKAIAVARRPGSAGREDRFYAAVASLYVAAVEGGSRKPVVDAATELSKRRRGTYEPGYVRDLLHVARQRELLTRPPKGRAGGRLTDKGLAALAEDAD